MRTAGAGAVRAAALMTYAYVAPPSVEYVSLTEGKVPPQLQVILCTSAATMIRRRWELSLLHTPVS
jgi:hypothetical protein